MAGIAVGSGLATQVVAKDEVTYGVAPSLTSGVDSFEINSETLELKKTTVQGQGLSAGKVYARTKRRVLTNYDVNGGVNLDLPTRNLGFWLRYMVGSFGQANATPTQIGTTGMYKSIHQPGAMGGHSFTLQKGVPAVDATVEPFTYVGCKLTSWQISVATGGLAKFTLNVDGRNELAGAGNSDPLNGSVPTLATFAMPTTGLGASVFHFREATLLTGGTPTLTSGVVSLSGATAAANVKTCDIQHAFGYDTNRVFLNGNGFKSEQIENALRAITGSFQVEWLSSEAMYNAYAADTTTSLELTFTGAIGGTTGTNTYLLDIIIPNIKLEGESPKVPGPAVITQTANFTGLDDETTVPIQLTYQSEDSTL
jgi:hypothetical protein